MDSIMSLVEIFEVLFNLLWPLLLLALFVFLMKLVLKLYKDARLTKSGIAELDKLDGEDFEKYLALLFRQLGYKVTRTPYQGDFGADLVIQKAGVQTVVQAKRYNRTVGVKAIQEAVAAKEYYRCNSAMVVTNNYYSQQAKKLAAANHVELWDRSKLVDLLLSRKQTAATDVSATDVSATDEPTDQPSVIPTAALQPTVTAMVCAACGKAVSSQVNRYCLRHQERFGGQIYCYEHQKIVHYQTSRAAKSVQAKPI